MRTTTLYVDGKSRASYADVEVSVRTGHGVQIIRSTDTWLNGLNVHDCLLSGIRDFATRTNIQDCVIRSNGKDGQPYNGDGILLQGSGHIVHGCRVENNGDNTTFEHGIYASSVARNYLINNNVLVGNAASGIKASGGGKVVDNTISGSVRGIVLADTVPAKVLIRQNKVSATLYAVIITSNADLSRFDSDENTFAPGSRFMDARTGKNYDLTGWQKATGLEKHSVIA